MNILAIDTATPYVTVGAVRLHDHESAGQSQQTATPNHSPRLPLLEDIAEASGTARLGTRGHNESLMPSIMEALDSRGWTAQDIDRVIVGTGPGPFTGLRVGMATANAFAQAINKPVVGVSTLDVLAWSCVINPQLIGTVTPDATYLLVATDARRKEVYWALYELRAGESVIPVTQPAVNTPADVIAQVRTLSAGKLSALMLTDSIAAPFTQAYASQPDATASPTGARPLILEAIPDVQAFILAARTTEAWDTATNWATSPTLQPLYLRRPDAVPPKHKPISPAIGEAVIAAARNSAA